MNKTFYKMTVHLMSGTVLTYENIFDVDYGPKSRSFTQFWNGTTITEYLKHEHVSAVELDRYKPETQVVLNEQYRELENNEEREKNK